MVAMELAASCMPLRKSQQRDRDQTLQRVRALRDCCGMPREQVEKPLFPVQKGATCAMSQNCHKLISVQMPTRPWQSAGSSAAL
jgi:hypothetical protein